MVIWEKAKKRDFNQKADLRTGRSQEGSPCLRAATPYVSPLKVKMLMDHAPDCATIEAGGNTMP